MSEGCDHNCDSCSSKCDEASLLARTHELSDIKKVIGIVSGKGGVGKSLVSGLMAVLATRAGKKCAILDADITGPSIPKMFGLKGTLEGDESGIYPMESETGIKVISTNFLLGNENDPVIWRGPVIANMVKQFWTDVIWGDIDYMFIDMPPGTGDVPLTVFQSIKVDGIIVVTSPQELVSMIVGKAVKMANMMNIPVLGVVENMSYIKCPHCDEEIAVYGDSKIDEVATEFHLKVLARMPIEREIALNCDKGRVEDIKAPFMDVAISEIIKD